MSTYGETYWKKIDDALADRGFGRRSAVRVREAVAAHLVMNLADLRLRKRASERARRRGQPSH